MRPISASTKTAGSPVRRGAAPGFSLLERHPLRVLFLLYAVSVALFLGSLRLPRVDGQIAGSDGLYYYSYLPSILLDRDLDFTNQYRALLPKADLEATKRTPDGRPHNQYAVGPAILWAPFFLVGHLLALALGALGRPVALDGIGCIYQVPTFLGSLSYGFAGVLLLYRSCAGLYSRTAGVCAAIVVWLATNLIYYMIAEPSMAHACSFFAASLFLNLWIFWRPCPSIRRWLLLGLAGGIIMLVRQPDATWLILPVMDIFLTGKNRRACLPGLLVYVAAAVFVFLPQLIVWHFLNGSTVTPGYNYAAQGTTLFNWLSPEIVPLLFSLRHGLFSWHPALIPAAAGVLLLIRKDKALALSLGAVFLSQACLIGAWISWWGGHSFGSRMLITSLPVFGVGLAALVDWCARRRALWAAAFPACGFVLWNALFFLQYRFGYISKDQPITFAELTLGKFEMLRDLPSRLLAMLR